MRCLLILLSLALFFAGCGDWGTDGPDHGAEFYMRSHYYYGQDCSWVADVYVCGEAYALSRPLDVSVTVNWNGDARVYYDGTGPFDFWDGEYAHGYDDLHYDEYYYQFNLDGNYSLTVYVSGAEVIYADTYTGIEHHYYHEW